MRVESALRTSYEQLSYGKRINRAADDAAGLAISQKLTSQINGYDTGTNNALTARDLAYTAEGALSSMGGGLQRIRELAVQASNGILTDDDRQAIQDEIGQLKESIGNTAKSTEFNTIKVLDGTFTDKNVASNPSGTGMKMNIQNSSLETLGIADFDVTKPFSIDDIDGAISKVSQARSNLGATTNALSSTVNSNQVSSYNLTASDSRIEDLDYGLQTTKLGVQNALLQYSMHTQKMQMSQSYQKLSILA